MVHLGKNSRNRQPEKPVRKKAGYELCKSFRLPVILHLTTVHPRFDVRIFVKEAKTLASHRPYKVLLMVADGKGCVIEEQGRVSIHDFGRLGGGRLGRLFIGPWRAFLAICRIKPAVVHFHDPELIPLGMLLKAIGYKVIYDIHEDVPTQTYAKHYIPKFIRHFVAIAMSSLERCAAKSLDVMIPATPKIAERFPKNKTVVVQNFPICNELIALRKIPYEDRDLSFAYVGGIAKIRGAFEMIRAFECLSDIKRARLELAGEFSPSRLEDELRMLPGWASVNYHGQVAREQVAHLLGGVRAGLVTLHATANYLDSYPVKMFEYMSAGIPVIASNFPLWRQIIDREGCGLIVDPLNPQAIAKAMRWILDHPAEAEAMGHRGRQAVGCTYNWDGEATKIMRLYDKLLAR